MARPNKKDDYFVRRIADWFRYHDTLPWSKLKQGDRWDIISGDVRFRSTGVGDIHGGIGLALCEVTPEKRPYVLRQLITLLEGKSDKKRKTKPDEIALVRVAWRRAKAKLTGLYKGDNPTFKKVDAEYYKLTGWHLDRRSLPNDCPVRPDKRGRKKATALKPKRRGTSA
jgi:hypothetical protein